MLGLLSFGHIKFLAQDLELQDSRSGSIQHELKKAQSQLKNILHQKLSPIVIQNSIKPE